MTTGLVVMVCSAFNYKPGGLVLLPEAAVEAAGVLASLGNDDDALQQLIGPALQKMIIV